MTLTCIEQVARVKNIGYCKSSIVATGDARREARFSMQKETFCESSRLLLCAECRVPVDCKGTVSNDDLICSCIRPAQNSPLSNLTVSDQLSVYLFLFYCSPC